ncbi:malectin domain-containing carbohydrate-binding protein [Gelidibacter salicanalis]|uniref:malectin domain-containing carbohydrate-binding protein n=1 Tax=Gelidibacter salicanalis TaxID=291193 RepID=UPI00147911F0|nr:malectin domain-containing carbohydrate-binding protein [Gelidibacter salicanalis]
MSQGVAQLPTEFQKVELLTGLANATTMKFAPDGRIFIVDRYGELLIYKPNTQTTVSAGVLPVFHGFEDGFLGLAFDPYFTSNQKVYIYYSVLPNSANTNRISQFSMDGDVLDLSSEIPMLEWSVQRTNSFHAGGDMTFDSQGNLYIAVGDNSNHGLYGAIDEKNSNNSVEKSSSHTNDYRGKILRIKPNADTGGYSIPPGNLFPEGTPLTLPEIYVMGARNPYRIFVDQTNEDWLFWCDVGPDANSPGVLGPEGLDEINLTKAAGNYGWPYFSGVDNDPYQVPYKLPSPFYNNPGAPENTSVFNKSPNNVGATILPPSKKAWLELFHKSYFAGPRYYYDASSTNQQRLPVEFDGIFFYYDFNTSKIWAIKMDASGNIVSNEQMAPSVFPSSKKGFIDMKIGPDGHMYILEYGTGCCPQNAGTGKLVRVDYIGISTNAPPNVVLNADVTSGSVPLTVSFNSHGTSDPNGDTSFTYGWDFQSDGIIDSITAETNYTFTIPGTYNVKLSVSDGNGGVGVQNITIHAGNNPATFNFNSPPDGGFVGWGDDITLDLVVNDQEDGNTTLGINCADVFIVPSLGHLNHFHDGATVDGCRKIITLQYEGHDIDGGADIFYVLGTNYTDQGGLKSFDQIQLHPKRKEAEYYDTQSGVVTVPNTDALLGGEGSIRVANNSYISFEGRNLLNIHSVRYRVASELQGGSIEMRIGSPNGSILSTTTVPSTGSLNNWINLESNFVNPSGKNDLYFVFKNASANQNIFDVNFVEFMGTGVSTDRSPPLINHVEALSETVISVEFSEYMDLVSAETLSNYSVDNGASILGATLLLDERTVLLSISPMNSNNSYTLTVKNSQNRAGLAVATTNFSLSIINVIRINAGGPQITYNGGTFNSDQFVTGGKLYNATIAIDGTSNDELYQTERYGVFTYDIPVDAPGEYDFKLHFAELYFGVGRAGSSGSRVFNVTIEGVPVLTNFDILAETNPAAALIKEFEKISVTDGFATIHFSKVIENPKISGIEIFSSTSSHPVSDVQITSPSNGSIVNQPFEVSFTVDNWTIEEGGTHLHYAVDGEVVGPHYNYQPITIENLGVGNHTIRLDLYDLGHTPIGVYDEVNFTVTGQEVCNSTPFPESWMVHQLEANPYTAVYTIPDFDLDGDGLKDIVTGGWWYKNPGSASGNWIKKSIGGNFGNVVHVYDFDGDGHLDLLGTQIGAAGKEYQSERLLWAKNDGNANFTIYNNIPTFTSGYYEPFLAGIAGGDFGETKYQMAINWNGSESVKSPVQMLTPSANPTTGTWTLTDISTDSSGEDIKAGDIDGDGDLDLFQGINWLRNDGNGQWTTFSTGLNYVTTSDRVQLEDFNGNGRLDGVVGQLGLGSNANRYEFAWLESPADPTQPWIKHVLSSSIAGSLSVSAVDIDFDGDMDIVVGEWRGARRLISFENDLCNSGAWITHILDSGDLNLEHHDGALVTDIDDDGDLDIISNGWLNHKVPRIYENIMITLEKQDPLANAGQDQTLILPANTTVLNGTGSDPDGGVVTFLWSQASGPNGATLTGSDTSQLVIGNLIEGDYIFKLLITDDENQTAFDELKVSVLPPATEGFTLRINTGGSETTYGGVTFGADQYFDTGKVLDRSETGLPQPYRSIRYGSTGLMWYDIPVPNGQYTIKLHFAEIWFGATGGGSGGVGSRVFEVRIENQMVESHLDVFAEAGGAQIMMLKSYLVNVVDGMLNLDFSSLGTGGSRHPIINAIEILGTSNTNGAPIANAGPDQMISLPTNNALFNGVGTDPDGGVIIAYKWTQLSGPNTANLNGQDTSDLNATGLIAGNYVFRLEVTDDQNEKGIDDVNIMVNAASGAVPIVSAGIDQTITLPNSSSVLIGTGSDPDGGTIDYLWTKETGPSVTLNGITTSTLTISNLVEGIYVFRLTVTDQEDKSSYDEVEVVVLPMATGGFALRINAGGAETTYNGNTFEADQYFNLGRTLDRSQTGLTQPFRSLRYGSSGIMGYNIPLPNGQYTVQLHFAETWFGATGGGSGGIGSRVFNVLLENELRESHLDVFAQAPGAEKLLTRTYVVNVTDRILNIDFTSLESGGVRHPIINAIEVLGTANSNVLPIADAGPDQSVNLPINSVSFNGSGTDADGGFITAYNWSQIVGPNTAILNGDSTSTLMVSDLISGNYTFRLTVTDDDNDTAYDDVVLTVFAEVTGDYTLRINSGGPKTTYNGNVFEADQYFDAGRILDRSQTGLSQPHRTIRYGSSGVMGYNIPVPNGQYAVQLHFAEVWFGASGGGSGGVGSRVFDVSMEGLLVEDNLDVFSQAGGAQTILIKSYLVNVNDAELNIDFSSLGFGGERHPIINAIEIIGVSANKVGKSEDNFNEAVALSNDSPIVSPKFDQRIRVVPNPAKYDVQILLADRSLKIIQCHIYDVEGRLVMGLNPSESERSTGNYIFSVTNLENAVYVMDIKTNDGFNSRHKIIVNR